MFKKILCELKHHIPFTLTGAAVGVFLMIFFKKLSPGFAYNSFYVLHPMHVFLSAVVTGSMFRLHVLKRYKSPFLGFVSLLILGYLGSIGIATLSDSLVPYLSETILQLPHRELHLGFIEKWWLVNLVAIAGLIVAYFLPSTRMRHGLHVLVSTWASLMHINMAMSGSLSFLSYLLVFVFLFIAVWLPCCASDIVFPLLFTKDCTCGICSGKKE